MENPATWGVAEHIVDAKLHDEVIMSGFHGNTSLRTEQKIVRALYAADLIRQYATGDAEQVVRVALAGAAEARGRGVIGLSVARTVTDALRHEGILHDGIRFEAEDG